LSSPLRTYQEALDFLFEFVDYEKVNKFKYDIETFNLSRVEALMDAVGSPQRRFPAIHIAGTKGKGSTATMTRRILGAAGKKAGLYTQPHLTDLTERSTVDGRPISRQALVDIVNEMKPYVERLRQSKPYESPTFFDLATTIAFCHCARENVDFGVIEVGLGGRLDSTNVCRPVVCGISLVDYDHVERLGHTLDKIAFEKAGIIKPGVPVAVWPQQPEAMAVIERVAAERAAPLIRVGRDVAAENVSEDPGLAPMLRFSIRGRLARYPGLAVPILGLRQATNAALAVAMLECLAEQGKLDLTPEIVARGLAQTRLPARMELVSLSPLILLDGAHNVISMRSVCETVARRFAGRRIILIFGVARDKDVPGVLQLAMPLASEILLTKSDSPRAASPADLLDQCRAMGYRQAKAFEAPEDALAAARALAGPEDVILITGSFYLAGKLRPLLVKDEPAG